MDEHNSDVGVNKIKTQSIDQNKFMKVASPTKKITTKPQNIPSFNNNSASKTSPLKTLSP
jgi:hypothetical protein